MILSQIIKHINEIPIDIYSKIPSLIYQTWNKQLKGISIYHEKVTNKKSSLPTAGNKIVSQPYRMRIYLTKSENDPLDIEYLITFRFNLDEFKLVLHDFFNEFGLDFDFDLFYNKRELLTYIGNELSLIMHTKLAITYTDKYLVFVDRVIIKTKSNIIIL